MRLLFVCMLSIIGMNVVLEKGYVYCSLKDLHGYPGTSRMCDCQQTGTSQEGNYVLQHFFEAFLPIYFARQFE